MEVFIMLNDIPKYSMGGRHNIFLFLKYEF